METPYYFKVFFYNKCQIEKNYQKTYASTRFSINNATIA